jgi:hypothetical protein
VMSDRIGLHQAFLYMSLISLISVPIVFLLPRPLSTLRDQLQP